LSLNLENSVKDLVEKIRASVKTAPEQAAVAERLLLASMTVMIALSKENKIDQFRLGNFTYTAHRLLEELTAGVKHN
jgi:hypothetical protein